ncbi:MAG: helix-turn-helix domain-containing protein [Oscillospiraceae bacterium]|nr:helix-turn-helix domain-containing protein [Oscillospiraceae bacterium]
MELVRAGRPKFEATPIAMSVIDAAAAIGISKTKMYELIKRDDCDFAFMIGGRRLINREKLEAWINRQTEGEK